MKNFYVRSGRLLSIILLSQLPNFASAQVSGTVFRDFNGNGVKNNSASFNEPFVAGISVKVTTASGAVFIATTNASGAYSFTNTQIPSGTAVRLEFSGLALGDFASLNGTGNGSNVQFITAPSTTANFAVNAPDDYWNNTGIPDPVFLLVQQHRGYTTNPNYAGRFSMLQINNTSNGPNPAVNNTDITIDTSRRPATFAQTGSIYGLAYQRKQERVFASALLKRMSGLGPQGAGGIYIATKSGANWAYAASFNLQGVTPSNGGGSLDFGSVTRVATPVTDDNYLPATTSVWTVAGGSDGRDNDAFAKTGTMSFGDIEASTDTIYMINLFQKKLIVFDASGTTASLNGASAAALGALTKAYTITSLPGCPVPVGAGNNIRPYGIKIYRGKGYLGVVSDAMSTQNVNDLQGYILSFDPKNIAAGFTTVLTINFNLYAGANFRPWVTTWAQAGGTATTGPSSYAQPMISEIEFNEDGSMDIGIRDRWGDQGAAFEFFPIPASTAHVQTAEQGDMLHACWNGSNWLLEGTSGSCVQPLTNGDPNVNPYNPVSWGASFGSTGREYYADVPGDSRNESFSGGMAKLMGSGIIVSTVYDPIGNGIQPGSNYWSTQGVQWNNVTTGLKTQVARTATSATCGMDKANSMGDIEFLGSIQPIQIGNRIWNDADNDGIQDAGENGLANIQVQLYTSTGVLLATVTTNANGNYFFDAATAGFTADPRKPADWTGVNGILPGFDYEIRINTAQANLAGYQLSQSNMGGATADNIDNDGTISGANAVANFNTLNVTHNFDFGFTQKANIGNRVWNDNNSNGIQDAGEPGIAGVNVQLYRNGTDGLPGTADDILVATTLTDAYGNYTFSNLAASTNTQTEYNIKVTAPANYIFTTQTNTTDATDNDNGSDVNATTGRSYSINLSAGETDNKKDIGLIFSQPTTASIGDKVWNDANGNGIQEAGETGMSGITVTLYNSTGNAIASTITDAKGNYSFTNLSAGTYSVGYSLVPGYVFSTKDAGGNDNTDSDVNTTGVNMGKTDNFTLTAGEIKTSIDAGLTPAAATTASLGDKVWNDLNQNGLQDAGEPGVAGVTVTLYVSGTAIATTTTDVFGNYIFTNLAAGANYQVGIAIPGGYTLSTADVGTNNFIDNDIIAANGNRTAVLALLSGQRNLSIDAGIYQTPPAGTARIGDKVWFDANSNGIQDASEIAIAGVTVTLYNNAGAAIATTITDANGNYSFVNLAAGTYSIGFSNLPAGYGFTGSDLGGNDATDSDVSIVTGRTVAFSIVAGQNKNDVNAGLISGQASGLGSIGNKIWYDNDGDGIQDGGNETGVEGVTVTLQKDINNDGDFLDAGEASFGTATTNALGEYLFTGLGAGSYRVVFSNGPAGYVIAAANQGSNDLIDSDGNSAGLAINSNTSTTGSITLGAGEENLTVDLGLINNSPATLGSISDKVFFDMNNDGVQSAGEPGVAGVTVTLYNGTGGTVIAVTTTDANGNYLFDRLAAGSYVIGFSNFPAGMSPTLQDLGQAGTSNSGAGAGSTAGTVNNNDTNTDSDAGADGKTQPIALTAGQDITNVDLGLVSSRASLGNYVWLDNNGNGTQDVTEPGVAGVTVSLYYDANNDGDFLDAGENTPVASMVTDQNGQYLFTNLSPGNYQAAFSTIPSGISFTTQVSAGDNGNNTNSDANANGRTGTINLVAGENEQTIDAGLYKPQAVIGNYVWVDTNGNGLQDAGEPGFSGVLVTLYNPGPDGIAGNADDIAISNAVSDGSGSYIFYDVAPGNYFLQYSNLPTGSGFTLQDVGSNTSDNTDSDVIVANGRTAIFTMPSTGANLSFDAGVNNVVTLPVRLEFTATKKNTSAVLVWTVTAERGVRSYALERSFDGRSFETLFSTHANGNVQYQHTDLQPKEGFNYYRVRIENADGSIEYSEVKLVNFLTKGTVVVYPNPAYQKVLVQIPDKWAGKALTIEISNQLGQTVILQHLQKARQTEEINIQQLTRGMYQIKLKGTETQQVVKQFQIN